MTKAKLGDGVEVVETKPEIVVVDGNHRFAGKAPEPEVRLTSLVASTSEAGGGRHDEGGEG